MTVGDQSRGHDRWTPRTRLRWRDLVSEALITLTLRPVRTLLTMLGTILGVGAFVAVLGLTATASGQISAAFSIWDATQVTVTDVGGKGDDSSVYSFPDNADALVRRIDGVEWAGRTWTVSELRSAATQWDPRTPPVSILAVAASPGYLRALEPTYRAGVGFDEWHDRTRQPVAVLGPGAARSLGISDLDTAPVVYLAGTPYTVIGILSDVHRNPTVLNTVMIPAGTALSIHGSPTVDSPAEMLIATRPGAADVVARQVPLALRPDQPDVLEVSPPVPPPATVEVVTDSLNAVFLALAGLTLLIGTIGIANTTLVSVLERTKEIGLRRALGARTRDVWVQILAETGALGFIGGLIGTALAVLTVLGTALANGWTALLNPWVTVTAPVLGAVTGLLAGLYPAVRAARIPPVAALRR